MKNLKWITISLVCLTLSACASTAPSTSTASTSTETSKTESQKIDAALKKAAAETALKGNKSHTLAYLAKIYTRKPMDANAAINYGAALREAGEYERAELVLAPFAKNIEAPAAAKAEYAGVQLALGNYDAAEKYAQKAVLQDEKQADAFHYLGIALDTKGRHKEAEKAYKKGIENWKGDPVPIMNNLALNLASQGFLDESMDILKKAKTIAPNRIEVERNLRIVKALQESYKYSNP